MIDAMADNTPYNRQSADRWSESSYDSYASDFSSLDDSSLIDEALDESANGTFLPDVSLILGRHICQVFISYCALNSNYCPTSEKYLSPKLFLGEEHT